MNAMEKRNRLAQPETEWAGPRECLIVIHEGDMVHTLSGMADTVSLDRDETLRFNDSPIMDVEFNGYDVSIHFCGGVTETLRPYDGGAE